MRSGVLFEFSVKMPENNEFERAGISAMKRKNQIPDSAQRAEFQEYKVPL
jgi:hypothetical protein